MFELLTGRTLFALMMLGHDEKEQEDTDDDHLIQLNDVIRPLPDSILESWPRASKWYTADRQRLQPHSDEAPYIHDSLGRLFAENKSPEIDDQEALIILELLARILEYDPQRRPNAEELLKEAWFSS